MNNTIRLSFFVFLLAFLSFQMTCSDLPISDGEVAETSCIDRSKIDPNKGCTREYKPVCGCDGKTYSNVCTAEKSGVTSWTDGTCPCIVKSLVKPNMPCTKEYAPVCGCDDKTYDNECMAKRAGVTKWTPGKCNKTSSNDGCIDPKKATNNPCAEVYEPVCGCDNKTYGNECEAKNKGVTSWTRGKCDNSKTCIDRSKIDPNAACAKIYKPVCGCDGKTYGNECEATKAGVTRWTPGKCGNSNTCIDPSKIDPNKGCTREYKPVCGCDDKTYSNECEATKAGVTRWTQGKCS